MNDREPMSGSGDCGGDAAAYVLGALEPQEVDAFRAHMQECAVCRDEVEALGGVVQALPLAAHQYEAPRGLRRRVLAEVRREQSAAGRPVRRPRRVWRGPRELFAGATAAVVVAAGALTAIELSAGTAASVFQASVSGISGSAQLRVTHGHAELLGENLTPAGRGHVYEIWLKSGKSAPVPADVLFHVDRSGHTQVAIAHSMRGVSTVMVTREPSGGEPHPTASPVIVAQLT